MHPYKELPPENFWRSGVSEKLWSDINFKTSVKFKLGVDDKTSTGGSCFALHIAKNLPLIGLTHFVTEKAPKILTQKRASELHYGEFSARYGNIYTARQLRQTIEFAFGLRDRTVIAAQSAEGWVDLLRPGVQSEPYDSLHDLECDRIYHLDCVKRMFLEADCFIFTAGLTEAWFEEKSDLVFPVCPGTKAGEYDPAIHKFINFKTSDVIEDLTWCVNFIRTRNERMKWVFTVSPVALAATATDQHVLLATSNSKAILRSSIDEVCNSNSNCEYFPSYEITASAATFGQFLDSDLRSISSRGVKLAVRVFQSAFVNDAKNHNKNDANKIIDVDTRIKAAAVAECDEAFNDPRLNQPRT